MVELYALKLVDQGSFSCRVTPKTSNVVRFPACRSGLWPMMEGKEF